MSQATQFPSFPVAAFAEGVTVEKTPEPIRMFLQSAFGPETSSSFPQGMWASPDIAAWMMSPEILNALNSPASLRLGVPASTEPAREVNPFQSSFSGFKQPAAPTLNFPISSSSVGSVGPFTISPFAVFDQPAPAVKQEPTMKQEASFDKASEQSHEESEHAYSQTNSNEFASQTNPSRRNTKRHLASSPTRSITNTVSSLTPKRKGNSKEISDDYTIQHRRELNKKAAERCRLRKLDRVRELTEEKDTLRASYDRLAQQYAEAEKELERLREFIKVHCQRGCSIPRKEASVQ